MTKPHRFPNCISSVRYAAVVCPREFDIDYNEAAFHWPSTLPFTFNSPMRLRDASPRRHCSTDCSTFIRKHLPYAEDIFSSIPSENLYILLKLIELDKFNFLVESRFPSFWINITFRILSQQFGYNCSHCDDVSFFFPLFFHTKKEIYLQRYISFLTMKDTRIQKLSFETSLNRNIAEKNKKDRSVHRKYRMELNRESKAF